MKSIQMEIFMKELFLKENLMEKGFTVGSTMKATKENGIKGLNMGMESGKA